MVASRVASSWVWTSRSWLSTAGSSPTGGLGGRPEPLQELARVAAAGVGVPAAERGQLGQLELGGGLRGGELGQEGQGNLGGRTSACSSPVTASTGSSRRSRWHRCAAGPRAWSCRRDRSWRRRRPTAAGWRERRPGRWDHRVAGGGQPVDDQAVGVVDRHGQLSRAAVAGQAGQHRVQILLRKHPAVDTSPAESRMVTAGLALAQSHPVNSTAASSRWSSWSTRGDKAVTGASLFGLGGASRSCRSRASARQGGGTEPGRLAASTVAVPGRSPSNHNPTPQGSWPGYSSNETPANIPGKWCSWPESLARARRAEGGGGDLRCLEGRVERRQTARDADNGTRWLA
jgi:hypothetical protein